MGELDDFLEDENKTLDDLSFEDETPPSYENDINTLGQEDAHYALIRAFTSAFSSHRSEALTVAVAEELDVLTNGRLTIRHRRIEAERMLMICHGNLLLGKHMRYILQGLQAKNLLTDEYYDSFLESVEEFSNFLIFKYTEIYKLSSEQLGEEIDLGLIEEGCYTNSNPIRKYGLNNPPSKNDNNSTI